MTDIALKSEFLLNIRARGFLHQATDLESLDTALMEGICTAYIGFDCTAPSLHVGNLSQIMMLRRLQQSGHKPIVLLGGGTTRIGDPSGKDQSRQMLSDAAIAGNMASIRRCFERFLTFGDGPTDAVLVNNADWLDDLGYIDFLRDVGPHFTINRMLTFDSVRLRLDREQPLTFLEFNYMILQAYDFARLAHSHGCILQMGGSDQWGNIVNGVELARRTRGRTLYGLTTPLITTADGQKMGKTAAGAVWLNADQLSDYNYWQYWRNTQDADVGRFLRLFTDMPLGEIERLDALEGAEVNAAKIALADAATTLARGATAAKSAHQTARDTFEAGGTGADLPVLTVAPERLAAAPLLIDLLAEAGLAASKSAARRLIVQGGARLNDEKIDSPEATLTTAHMTDGQARLSAGKKRHVILKLTQN